MNQRNLPTRLAACVLLGGLANAAGEPTGKSTGDYDRLALDIERLEDALAPSQQTSGVDVGFLLRSSYAYSGDDIYQPTPGEDLGGFRMQDAVLWFSGRVGAYEVFIRADGSDATDWPPISGGTPGAFNVRDAWARAALCDEASLYFGSFRCPVLNSSMLDEGKLAMIDRTRLGQMFDVYQTGAAVTGDVGPFHYKVAAQDGADGSADKVGMVVRGEYKIGEGAKQREGAYGAEGFDATFGAGYFNDGIASKVDAWVADAYVTLDGFSLHAEVMDMGGGLAGMMGLTAGAGATPYTATAGYRFTDNWEAIVRYQDLDDTLGTTQIGGGINYYVKGHAAKWQVNVSQLDNDLDDGMIFQIGLSLGSAFPNGAP